MQSYVGVRYAASNQALPLHVESLNFEAHSVEATLIYTSVVDFPHGLAMLKHVAVKF